MVHAAGDPVRTRDLAAGGPAFLQQVQAPASAPAAAPRTVSFATELSLNNSHSMPQQPTLDLNSRVCALRFTLRLSRHSAASLYLCSPLCALAAALRLYHDNDFTSQTVTLFVYSCCVCHQLSL